MVLTKKFEFLITPNDYEVLIDLSRHYHLSKAAIIRLALRDLHQKISTAPSSVSPGSTNPILRQTTTPPPPELDPFWKEFGK